MIEETKETLRIDMEKGDVENRYGDGIVCDKSDFSRIEMYGNMGNRYGSVQHMLFWCFD